MMAKRHEHLVRYVSPFGSPAWMPRAEAQQLLRLDDDRWIRYQLTGVLSAAQIEVGPPRIEH